MGKVIDIIGQKFNRLTVLERSLPNQNHLAMWKCKCDCGTEVIVAGTLLRNGHTKSCGCLQKEKATQCNLKDITGQKFGRLIVIEKDRIKKGNYWKCKCDCGNIVSARGVDLKREAVQSCGCLQKEKVKQYNWQPLDLIGQRFGKLVVLKRIENDDRGNTRWECRCDCGNILRIRGGALTTGNTKSCGCLSSKGNAEIKQLLQKHNIKYQDEFLIQYKQHNYKFDFAILEGQKVIRLIEFDGEQHYKEVPLFKEGLEKIQERDEEKNQWAKEHNIPLVRIPYWERDSITLDIIFGDKYLVK